MYNEKEVKSLHEEYLSEHPDGYLYSSFKRAIRRHRYQAKAVGKSLEAFNSRYSSAEVSSVIGDYYLGEYKDSTALAAYEEALALEPAYTPALLGKSEVYRIRRNYPGFFSTLQEFLRGEDTPAAAKAQYLQNLARFIDGGTLRNHLSDFDTLYELGLAQHPADSAMLTTVGGYFTSSGRREKGKEIFRRGARLYPDHKGQQLNYLQLLYISQEWEALRDRSDTLMQRFPDETVFYELNNAARFSLKDYAGITKELITVGSNRVIEVWSKENWDAELDPQTGELLDASEAAEGLEIYGF